MNLNWKIEEIIQVNQRKVRLNRNGGYTIPLVFNCTLRCEYIVLFLSAIINDNCAGL